MYASWYQWAPCERWQELGLQREDSNPSWKASWKDPTWNKLCNCVGGFQRACGKFFIATWRNSRHDIWPQRIGAHPWQVQVYEFTKYLQQGDHVQVFTKIWDSG